MFSTSTLGALLALTNAIAAIPYDGPIATPVAKRWSPEGFTPKPTSEPKPLLEMFRRQTDPEFCGYLEGDPEFAVTCRAGSSCMYDDLFSWFGCCTGTSITDCNVITACVESTKLDECLSESSCANDVLALACTDSEEPYCMGLYTVVSSETYGHFECAASDTTYEVFSTTADSSPSFTLVEESSTEGEDEPTPTPTRFRPSETETVTAEDAESTATEDDDEESTTEDSSPTFTRGGPRPQETTETATATAAEETSTSSSSAGAMRTAQAVLGAAGGIAGLVAVLA